MLGKVVWTQETTLLAVKAKLERALQTPGRQKTSSLLVRTRPALALPMAQTHVRCSWDIWCLKDLWLTCSDNTEPSTPSLGASEVLLSRAAHLGLNAMLSTSIGKIEKEAGVKYHEALVALARRWIGKEGGDQNMTMALCASGWTRSTGCGSVVSEDIKWIAGKKDIHAKYGNNKVVVTFEPLKVSLLRGGKEQVVLNGNGLLHMEHFRSKVQAPTATEEAEPEAEEGVEGEEGSEQVVMQVEEKVNHAAWFEGDKEDDWWEEKFSLWTDTKLKGPESLSIDVSFPNHGTIYGIPQHATTLALPTTTGDSATFTEPYRLWNSDVFEYIASSPMSLYGSIPVLHAHSANCTVGIFHAVGSETWINVSHPTDKSTKTHWTSESGILDIFLMPGPTPDETFAQYARLTGIPVLPPHWSLGYHQYRWNYISSDDVRTVQKRFDEEDMPVDVFWLDIEYSEEHNYFIWEQKSFPDPVEMTNDVAAVGRKMVVIIDPHLKRTSNYLAFQEASDRKVLVKPASGEGEYEGWCWSGSSSWIDFFNPNAWDWWKDLFKTTPLASGGWS
ncbi:glycosyl hydrolases family 31-domain-containing protein [Mycena amicta]|nr:glycosyl hydrolases family 31-domain-containing protein [Mycena amicta]